MIFKGIKTNGDVINFSQEIKAGITIWIADNLRGKSSLFKIIKFALTGRNDLKHDVKKWLTHILVGFRINDKHYSVYFDRSSRSLLAKLYGKDFASFLEVEDSDLAPIFEVTNEEKYQDNIEDFFFKQFSYYSLKWTQKDSRKEVNELNDARASWATYFKSIFLESKDSDRLMYGDQGKKIFQMLLGLQLTYPDLLILLDTSGSMGELENCEANMHQAVLASFGVVKYFESKSSEIALIGFADRLSIFVNWTKDYQTIKAKMMINGSGGTNLPISRPVPFGIISCSLFQTF